MTEHRWEEELARLIDEHVAGEPHNRNDLNEALATESVELLDIADLLWEAAHGAPPLERDPVAAMLGLVPDSARSLSGAALKRALQAAGLHVSTLAQKLSDRGWDVATHDVFNWQTRDDAAVPPALIQAIAEVTGVAPEKLTIDRGESPAHRALKSVTSSAEFQALAERWARLRGTTIDLGASALESRLAASVFRGSQPDEAQLLASLEALVAAIESETRSDEGH
jgi:hypothetical protein